MPPRNGSVEQVLQLTCAALSPTDPCFLLSSVHSMTRSYQDRLLHRADLVGYIYRTTVPHFRSPGVSPVLLFKSSTMVLPLPRASRPADEINFEAPPLLANIPFKFGTISLIVDKRFLPNAAPPIPFHQVVDCLPARRKTS
ncbi:uncharacterized protein LDX57_009886 [Aspergillus melleus]|uniref:uncharacterized protein n=1 Tax=Aspergillus melleus TaxID=138277 RepID=UPI001E8E1CE2|nr:uncharacterized protein LDX57_009886 [Aspergillus melleus]KAH8432247.1 hypothetical protein LDX57_009886 [Aspergillus melleus]